jgi:hypothetical protein
MNIHIKIVVFILFVLFNSGAVNAQSDTLKAKELEIKRQLVKEQNDLSEIWRAGFKCGSNWQL